MSDHPLLMKVVKAAVRTWTEDGAGADIMAVGVVAAIPAAIAGHIEVALAQCRDCGWPPDGDRHTNHSHYDHHAYIPWVTP